MAIAKMIRIEISHHGWGSVERRPYVAGPDEDEDDPEPDPAHELYECIPLRVRIVDSTSIHTGFPSRSFICGRCHGTSVSAVRGRSPAPSNVDQVNGLAIRHAAASRRAVGRQ